MTPACTLRPATDADKDQIASIWHASAGLPGVGPARLPPVADFRRRLDGEIANGWRVCVAEARGVQGFVATDPGRRVLCELFVCPDWLGRGIGRRLLEHAKAEMPEGFTLYTSAANTRARRFYEREGLSLRYEAPHPRSGHAVAHYGWLPADPSWRAIPALYDGVAAVWAQRRDRSLFEAAALQRFDSALPQRPARILDFGCGDGQPIAAHLIGRGHALTGIDIAPAMIARARQAHPDHDWRLADMRGLALGARFDGMIAWHSMFHLRPADQCALFQTFARHAAPRAALTFTSGPRAGEAIGRLEGASLYHASLAPEDYCRLLGSAGFRLLSFRPEDPACGGATVWLAQRMA